MSLPPLAAPPRARETTSRPRRLLLIAAVLAAAGIAALCAVPRLLGAGYPPWWVPIVSAAVLLVAGVLAGQFGTPRRHAEQVLILGADVASFALVGAGALAASVVALGRIPDDNGAGFLMPVLVSAATAATLSVALRIPARRAARRAARGGRFRPDDVLATFGEQTSRDGPLEQALVQLADALRRTLALRRVEIWTGAGGRLTAAVVLPEPPPRRSSVPSPAGQGGRSELADAGLGQARPGETLSLSAGDLVALSRARVAGPGWLSLWVPRLVWARPGIQLRVVPARASGALLGLLVVERWVDDPRFSEAEDRLLAELGTRLGAVLHNRQLDANLREALVDLRRANDELRVSRARLVAAADAERRRIERDLHDGAQQQLVSLAIGLRLVRDLVTEDTEAAEELIGEMAEQVTAAISEVRNLAQGIYPPLLRSSGLTEALRAAASRSPLGVRLVTDGVGRHGPDVEAAVYFCCLEALQNAAKHAPGSQVEIALTEREDALAFSVADDGPGFDPRRRPAGQGLTNMRDRIGAIGGSLVIGSAPGEGVRLGAVVPLADNTGSVASGLAAPSAGGSTLPPGSSSGTGASSTSSSTSGSGAGPGGAAAVGGSVAVGPSAGDVAAGEDATGAPGGAEALVGGARAGAATADGRVPAASDGRVAPVPGEPGGNGG
ncbi:GAF domain-containing sensor histidine kinase [Pseudofrankia sp. BMG5.36]|uniref:sensor histidine kinase n=1 Tax=Pseudofrankia sp. BMG5.36 TaxID=1834512 RepID=UPI0009F73228|nr:GAF domain-containing sensor histidine kinase [Pseudofrankia sp. BMG5.36]